MYNKCFFGIFDLPGKMTNDLSGKMFFLPRCEENYFAAI
jgi:hypothetical protein